MQKIATTTIDFDINGKQHGFLQLPYTSENIAWGNIQIPVCSIRRGTGPTLCVIGGVHGDEYEGPVTIMRLARELQLDEVNGGLILIPCLNTPAVLQGSRLSPLDNKDMSQAFGQQGGSSMTEQIAMQLLRDVIPHADIVLDLRSGGRSLQFAPLAAVTTSETVVSPDKDIQQCAEACMIAFGAPNSARLPDWVLHSALYSHTAEQGKSLITAELGGGGTASAETLAIAHTGCRNVLSHVGLIEAPLTLRASRMLEVRHDDALALSPASGLIDMRGKLGNDVYQGDVLALIIDPTQTGVEPVEVRVPRNGVLMARHHAGHIHAGDCLALIADEVQR